MNKNYWIKNYACYNILTVIFRTCPQFGKEHLISKTLLTESKILLTRVITPQMSHHPPDSITFAAHQLSTTWYLQEVPS
jgi:hypothetical protein